MQLQGLRHKLCMENTVCVCVCVSQQVLRLENFILSKSSVCHMLCVLFAFLYVCVCVYMSEERVSGCTRCRFSVRPEPSFFLPLECLKLPSCQAGQQSQSAGSDVSHTLSESAQHTHTLHNMFRQSALNTCPPQQLHYNGSRHSTHSLTHTLHTHTRTTFAHLCARFFVKPYPGWGGRGVAACRDKHFESILELCS